MRCKSFLTALAVTLLCLTGCVAPNRAALPDDKLKIVTTIFAPYEFARAVSGDHSNLTMLVKPGAESHSFEPTPTDILAIQNADLFIYVGGESDLWAQRVLESMDSEPPETVALLDCVLALEEEIVEGMEAENEEVEDEHEVEYDEHVWTSPLNTIQIIDTLEEVLCTLDETNAEEYRKNAREYTALLYELDIALRDVTSGGERNTLVFADRFPFRYLAEEYNLNYFAAFPGCSTETEPSASTISFLMNKVREENIPVVFYTEQSNGKMPDAISEETGAKPLLLHACHNISKADFDSKKTYVNLMWDNVINLEEALN